MNQSVINSCKLAKKHWQDTDLLYKSSPSACSSHLFESLGVENLLNGFEDEFDASGKEFTQICQNHEEQRDSNASVDNSDDPSNLSYRSDVTVTCVYDDE